MTVQTYLKGANAVNIARSVEEAVAAGRMAPGAQLPTVRGLAASLQVSPATVAAAYRLLQERGMLVADGRRGTRIRTAAPIAAPLAAPLPSHARDLAAGNPDADLLPRLETAIPRARVAQRLYGDSLNDVRLVQMARDQFAADHVPDGAVAVVGGALDGIERVLREHLRAGDRVIVEDPAFTGVIDLLNANGLVPVPVPVDDESLVPAELRPALRSAAAIIVTPRAQNPTGAAISARRARDLQRLLAGAPDLLLIEDDHAGPIAGAPYRTLVTASTRHWAVVRSVSKSLGPDLRVALMAGDPHTVARVEGRQQLGVRWVSHLLQRLVAALWGDRAVQRLLVRAEKTYTARREALIAELRARGIEARGASGLNVWIPVREEAAVVQALLGAGWAVNAGERYRIRSGPAIRVTISTLEPADAANLADDLDAALRSRGAFRS